MSPPNTPRVNIITTVLGIAVRSIILWFQLVALGWFIVKLHTRDAYYTALALLLPKRPVGRVIKRGDPGFAGIWPTYAKPAEEDSRSPCPGINALANHGIIPRNGRRVTYKQLSEGIQKAYNLCPALGDQLTASAFILDGARGCIDLGDLNALGVVQHDASFTRHDIAYVHDQSAPDPWLVERFAKQATARGPDGRAKFTLGDIAYYNGIRRAECKASNGQYSMNYSFFHKFFGSGNCAMLYSIFGGDAKDLTDFLMEERFADGWEPKVRWHSGHTILFAQITTLQIEFNTFENQRLRGDDVYFDQRVLKKL